MQEQQAKAMMAQVPTGGAVNARTGVGLGIGAILGFVMGGPIGAGLGAILGASVVHTQAKPKGGVMTPKRRLIYTRAMESVKSPEDMRTLAAVFAGEGLHGEASMLRKRAALREAPAEVKEKRRNFYRMAMSSDDPEGIQALALEFLKIGAVDVARTLNEHAAAVKAAKSAGESAEPLPEQMTSLFAEKLLKALTHFGPQSNQAASAARNYLKARGIAVSPASMKAVIQAGLKSIMPALPEPAAEEEAPAEEQQEEQQEEAVQEETPAEQEAAPAAEAVAAPVEIEEAGGATAPEPAVIGPQPGPIEPQALTNEKAAEIHVQAAAEVEAEAEAEAAEEPKRVRVG